MSDAVQERPANEPPDLDSEEVRELLAEGREQGFLTAEHVQDRLQDVDLTAEQIDDLFIAFNELSIDIVESDAPVHGAVAEPEEAVTPKLDLSIKTQSSDPVRFLPHRDRQGTAADRRARGRPGQAHRTPRHAGQAEADRSQPPPGRLYRQAVRLEQHVLPRLDPGGQPRPHPRRREVRLPPGLQVLDLRHLVDPPGHHPRHGQPGAHHPRAGAHGRTDQQARARAAQAAVRQRARAHTRRDRRRDGHHAGQGARDPRRSASSRSASNRPSATRATRSSAIS